MFVGSRAYADLGATKFENNEIRVTRVRSNKRNNAKVESAKWTLVTILVPNVKSRGNSSKFAVPEWS